MKRMVFMAKLFLFLLLFVISCSRNPIVEDSPKDEIIGSSSGEWEATVGAGRRTVNVFTKNDLNYLYAATDSGLFRSIVGGSKWVHQGLGNIQLTSLITYSDRYVIMGTPNGDIYYSLEGGSQILQSEKSLNVQLFYQTKNGDIFASTTNDGLWQTTTHGSTWTKVENFDKRLMTVIPNQNQSKYFAGCYGYGVWFSTNGIIWTSTNINSQVINTLAFINDSTAFYSRWGSGLFFTNNTFNSSVKISIPIGSYLEKMVLAQDDQVYIATSSLGVFVIPGLETSKWKTMNKGLPSGTTTTLLLDHNQYLYVGVSGNGIYRTKKPLTKPE